MNCKPGDLAIIVRSHAGNEGKIVRCIRLISAQWKWPSGLESYAPTWEIDVTLKVCDGDLTNRVPDEQLRPIRPQPDGAQDETLTWLPVPAPEEVA